MDIEDALQSLWTWLDKHKGLILCSMGVDSRVNSPGNEIFVVVKEPIPEFVHELKTWEGFKVRVIRKIGP